MFNQVLTSVRFGVVAEAPAGLVTILADRVEPRPLHRAAVFGALIHATRCVLEYLLKFRGIECRTCELVAKELQRGRARREVAVAKRERVVVAVVGRTRADTQAT